MESTIYGHPGEQKGKDRPPRFLGDIAKGASA
jgi:hypothetical protein